MSVIGFEIPVSEQYLSRAGGLQPNAAAGSNNPKKEMTCWRGEMACRHTETIDH